MTPIDRLTSAIVLIAIDEGTELELGAGVLVNIGGREFVLTAGHNVLRSYRAELSKIGAAQLPRDVSAFFKPADGSIARTYVQPGVTEKNVDPDVAVLELSADAKVYATRRPFNEGEISFFRADAPSRVLALGGFPAALAKYEDPIAGIGKAYVPMKQVTINAHSLSGFRHPTEPHTGHGVHVYLSDSVTIEKEGVTSTEPNVHPGGLSGGPLVVPDGEGTLVGLVRSSARVEGGRALWCEPAVEAIRHLLSHDDGDVAAAAQRIVDRCDALRDA